MRRLYGVAALAAALTLAANAEAQQSIVICLPTSAAEWRAYAGKRGEASTRGQPRCGNGVARRWHQSLSRPARR